MASQPLDDVEYDPANFRPSSPEYQPRSEDEEEGPARPKVKIITTPRKKRYFYRDGNVKLFTHWPPGSKGDLTEHMEANPELYMPLVYSSEYDYSEDEEEEDKPTSVYQWAQRYPHGIPSWCFKDFTTPKPPKSNWDEALFEEVDITVERTKHYEDEKERLRQEVELMMYSPEQRAKREKNSASVPVKEESSEAPSPSTFDTDFFLPTGITTTVHNIPEVEIKRKRESDEETVEYPREDNGMPLSVSPYDTTWECLGRPNPKACRTQYLIYEHKAAETAQGEYMAKMANPDSDFYERQASLVMSTRYSMLVAHYREELEYRAKQGEKIPLRELFDESADV